VKTLIILTLDAALLSWLADIAAMLIRRAIIKEEYYR
jgi:hypothetical protein